MNNLIADGLFLPALALVLVAWLVPKLLSMALPEGVKALLLNAFLSTFILFVLSALFFVCLYVWRGVPLSELGQLGFFANAVFFSRLGLIAALLWAPVMILSVAGLPRTWTKETW